MFARIVIVWLMVFASAAHADGKSEARPFVETGDRDYKLGKFDEALVAYTRAYELFPAPAILFNLGQCQRNLKNFERAVFFYEGYLRDRPDAPNRALVEDLIRESRAALEQQNAEARARKADEDARRRAADEDARRARAEAERQRAEDRRVVEVRAPGPEPRGHAPIYKRWWFWTAVGAAAATAGGTAYYFSGSTTTVLPSGTLGGIDRR